MVDPCDEVIPCSADSGFHHLLARKPLLMDLMIHSITIVDLGTMADITNSSMVIATH